MVGNERIRELVDRWEELRRLGVAATAEELCGDSPELIDEMRQWVSALKATDWLCDADTAGEIATTTEKSRPPARPSASKAEPFRQFTIGEYTVLGEIGHGGMGSVYRARHRAMNRLVALKILPAAVVESPEMVGRFHREMRAVAQLAHPNIVSAYDAGQCEGTHFLAMELIDGVDLARYVRERGPLPIAEAINYILQAAQGLAYAHAAGVIHRDIKPPNLLLDKNGRIKIIDLGLARFDRRVRREENGDIVTDLTKSGAVFGTVAYMAPEPASGGNRADQRADVYSLGCTLCFLLTGQPVFPGESELDQLVAHRDRAVPSLAARRGDVPGELDRLFQKMVAKKPEDRCQSMREVIDGLQAVKIGRDGAGGPAAAASAGGGEKPKVARTFDPYYKWLGIRPEDQPPHHYRLLGIEPFETDVEVIEDAAMQRMAHVRSYSLGPHSDLSQKILNELAAAKTCLLDQGKKAAYDAALRQRQAERAVLAQRNMGMLAPPPVPPAPPVRPPAAPAAAVSPAAPARMSPQRRKIILAATAVGLGGLLVMAVILLKIKTPQGILVVEVDQPDATVVVDGDKNVTITTPATKEAVEVRLKDGKHGVTVARSGFQPWQREIVVKAGQREEVKIHMEPLDAVGSNVQPSPPRPGSGTRPAAPPAAAREKLSPAAGAARPLLSADWRAAYENKLPEGLRRYRDWTETADYFRDALRVEEVVPQQKAAKETQWLAELGSLRGDALIPAINGLAKLQSRGAVPGLLKIAADPSNKDARYRWLAIRALGLIGDDSVVPDLVHLTYFPSSNARFWAQISLARLTGQSFGRDLQAWAAWWSAQGHKPEISTERVSWATPRPEWADPDKQIEQDQKTLNGLKAGTYGRTAQGRAPDAAAAAAPNAIVEGFGLKDVHVGTTRQELLAALGKPDSSWSYGLLKWPSRHIDCVVHPSPRNVTEIRLDAGFPGALGNGLRVGSPDTISKFYGEPESTAVKPGAKAYKYPSRGIIFWTNDGKIAQIVVFRPHRVESAEHENEKDGRGTSSGAKKVDFVVGPSQFLPGDKIEIQEVYSELGSLATGDTVRVKGVCTLSSHSTAALSLSITTKARNGHPGPPVRQPVQAGTASFDLERPIPCDGHLHLGLYDGHGSFGSLYFGTDAQMKEIARWSLQSTSSFPFGSSASSPNGPAAKVSASNSENVVTGLVFKFDDQAFAEKYWEWNDPWTFAKDGGSAPKGPRSFLRSRQSYLGNLTLDMDFSFGRAALTDTGGCWIVLWGKRFVISNRGENLRAQVHIHREGNEIVFVLNGAEKRAAVEPAVWSQPTAIDIYWHGRPAQFHSIQIKAQGMQPADMNRPRPTSQDPPPNWLP